VLPVAWHGGRLLRGLHFLRSRLIRPVVTVQQVNADEKGLHPRALPTRPARRAA